MSDKEVIRRGIYAALGTVKLDYRSSKRLDEAAGIIADFVVTEIARDLVENCKHPPHMTVLKYVGRSLSSRTAVR